MRITQQSLAARTYENLQASLARSARLQDQLSSGRQLTRASDAPGQAASAMQLRGALRTAEQYGRNADDATAWLTVTDSALQSVTSALQRVRDLAVQGANSGAIDDRSRLALADEVRQIRDTVLGLANTRYLGRPVFGGTVAGGSAYQEVAGVVTYVGDTGSVARRVGADALVRADTPGLVVFGDGPGGLFDTLDTLVGDLTTNAPGLATAVTAVDGVLDDVVAGLADVGARANRIEAMRRIASDQVVELRRQLSEVEDIDLPATIVDLQLQEVAYQAALGATARVLQPSLLDFLR